MTEEEYEVRRAQLAALADEQKKVFNDARLVYEKTCEQMRMLRLDWNEQKRAQPAQTHRYAGHDKRRAESGKPGHCEGCAKRGHVVTHPKLGCSDVGCGSAHNEEGS